MLTREKTMEATARVDPGTGQGMSGGTGYDGEGMVMEMISNAEGRRIGHWRRIDTGEVVGIARCHMHKNVIKTNSTKGCRLNSRR